ncbi:ribonuclease HI [Candidatus Deianiraea vastatrix]|uniref:Ribonuclease H n=1 Tax=Candidatus Deianiraea vastatrix TaxID=2163644 RepID=A0A5B8XED0_9RICK|nr:ribonuclease HI [Candidatus Deianiraea vastatrix]QED23623.1 Ribonuclease HI [Candidatus Deianiraea vastatrix]
MKKIKIYTDGACSGNPGKGGWGAVLIYETVEKHISGSNPNTTNNQMELTAIISALKTLKEPCHVELFSDSKYALDGITKWIFSWKKNNWKTADKKPVKNQELWQEFDKLASIHDIKFTWVKGHSGDKYNEIADSLATSAI